MVSHSPAVITGSAANVVPEVPQYSYETQSCRELHASTSQLYCSQLQHATQVP